MGRIGLPELLIILVIVVLIFGANRLPELGRGIGKGIKNFKDGIKDDEQKSWLALLPAGALAPPRARLALPGAALLALLLPTSVFFQFRPASRHAAPPLVLAHGVENVHEPEFDLAALHVDAHDLHAHLVAETIRLFRVLAAQHVLLLE